MTMLVSYLTAYAVSNNEFRTDIMFYFLFFAIFVEDSVRYRKSEFGFILRISFYVVVFLISYLLEWYTFGYIALTIFYWKQNHCYMAIKRIVALRKKYKADKRRIYQQSRIKKLKRQKQIEKKHNEKSIDLFSVQTFNNY